MKRVARWFAAPIRRRRRASGCLGGEGGVCRRGQTLGEGVGNAGVAVKWLVAEHQKAAEGPETGPKTARILHQ